MEHAHQHEEASGASSVPILGLMAAFSSWSSQLLQQTINFIMIIGSALMIWKGLMVVTGSESPIVVVLR